MKLPVPPPPFDRLIQALLSQPDGSSRYGRLLSEPLGPAPGGKYRHWDTFRHTADGSAFSLEEQWLVVKLARRSLYRALPLRDVLGTPFRYALPDVALEMLHRIDRSAGGSIQGSEQVLNPATRDTYLFKSLVEEAITSSQLEGASTTRKVAKAMIQEGRSPETRSERMILNNFHAMQTVLRFRDRALTPSMVIELQSVLTDKTLDDATGVGRLRRADEEIVVEDETGTRLHTPPPASELEHRLRAMCAFANDLQGTPFVPPAVRAILLHFWLAYDHPFIDGNGRTARALFYWSMARQGYWLAEYVSISRILKKARARYTRAFLYTESDENDTTYFVLYHLRVFLRAIDELHQYLATRAIELREAEHVLRRMTARHEINARQLALLNHALKHSAPRYTVDSHRRSHGVSYETARADLTALQKAGLLRMEKLGRAFTFLPGNKLARLARATSTSR
jgi:Fic family protein